MTVVHPRLDSSLAAFRAFRAALSTVEIYRRQRRHRRAQCMRGRISPIGTLQQASLFRSAMIRRCLYLAVCLPFALVTAQGQSNYAVVRGSVLDPQHRPVAGARVHLTSTDTGAQREVAANATGLYEIAAIQPGSYELTVENSGFQQSK